MPITTPTLWGQQVTVSTSALASGSSIAPLAAGGFAIVWQGNNDLFGQRFNVVGEETGGNFLASLSATTSPLSSPEAVELADGKLAVGYVFESSSTDHDIYTALRSGPSFSSGTDFNSIDSSGQDDVFVYEAEQTQDGNFAVLWQRDTPGNGNDPLFFQKMDSSGTLIGPRVLVDPTSVESQSDADLATLANGNIVVTWRSFDFSTLTSTLYFRVYNAQGTPITNELSFAPTSNPAFSQVESLANGNFVIVWQDVSDGGIYHRVFDESGGTVGIQHFYNAGFSILPKITALQDGGYIIGWSDFNGTEGDGSADGSITIQRYDATGGIVGRPLIIDNPGDQSLEDMQTLSDGRVILTYLNETGDSTDVTRLVYQIIDPREAVIEGTAGDDQIAARFGDTSISGLEGDDRLVGLTGDDRLWGNSGSDFLTAGAGDDHLNGGSGNDFIRGDEGDDVLLGGSGSDQLVGRAGEDELSGNGGNDWLQGGMGRDLLTGGGGADLFDFDSVAESRSALAGRDLVADFVRGEDLIDLSTIDAKQGTAGNQSFTFIGSASFSAEGQIRFVQSASQTLVQVNTSGAGGAEMVIAIDGTLTLTASDFVL